MGFCQVHVVVRAHPHETMKKYKTILADPPWGVGTMYLDKQRSPIEDKYPTMKLEDIQRLPVSELADEHCDLFIWTTHTFLPFTFDVIKRWGFKYHICLTWDKGSGWVLQGFNRRTEFCLYAYKNGIGIEWANQAIPTLITSLPEMIFEPKRQHSQKPERFYRILEKKTEEPRLELFARSKRRGWDVWGNEVENDIELSPRGAGVETLRGTNETIGAP